ncbi:mitochondrial adenine nucleotide transporter BTL1 [Carex littledalei]|uniref:Mitochondrial adenine nucleotide transporter BTL1 n=1 Tax=Carex littledalei TaxID=544730 RepID=A0A833QT34_9POAL|nr:mitochondrial adenine nucleotide transporter BTL1 [Carex littledalei]
MDLERVAAQLQQSLKKRQALNKQHVLTLGDPDPYGLVDLDPEANEEGRAHTNIGLKWDVQSALRKAFSGRREAAEFVSGALAGAMAKAVLAPLETVRTRMVVGVGSRSIPATFAEIVQEGGWRGLWAGNAVNMLRIVPTQAIEFATFEAVRRALQENQHKDNNNSSNWADAVVRRLSPVAVGGAAAGIVSTLICHPLEVLKDRLTINRIAYPSLGAAVAKIHSEAGLGGFYAGLCPTLAGMLPYSTCYYFMYDAIKRSYCRANKKSSLSRPELLLVGALSGLTASTISFPLEVARKRLMVGAIQGKCPAHMFAALSEVLREEGVAGLYRGWGASCLKVMPTSGITWMFYEAWKDILLVNKQLPNF